MAVLWLVRAVDGATSRRRCASDRRTWRAAGRGAVGAPSGGTSWDSAGFPPGPAPSQRYERRRPEKTPLNKVVAEHLENWLEWRDQAERPVPGHVEDELRCYLECGILYFGFGRALCKGCGTGFIVEFSWLK